MKKSPKKLTLNRETLSVLDNRPLGHVNGAAVSVKCPVTLPCSETTSCDGSCGPRSCTCPTDLC
jgi:hypothetical protein